jgi:hypothetical protein
MGLGCHHSKNDQKWHRDTKQVSDWQKQSISVVLAGALSALVDLQLATRHKQRHQNPPRLSTMRTRRVYSWVSTPATLDPLLIDSPA